MCVFEEGFEVNAAAMTTAVAAAAAAHFDIVQKCEACLQSGWALSEQNAGLFEYEEHI